jgi:type IV pilus assembly protein PilV
MKTYQETACNQSGSSMIEVLVTLVILLVGLLGLAGLILQGQRSELESYQRVQALVLMQDMVGRINANRKSASCYAITTAANGTPYLGTDIDVTATPPTCAIGTATQQARAIQDMKDWSALLLGAAETVGTNNVGAMVGARGCVSYDATTDTYLVSVTWQGVGPTSAPSSGLVCATGLYGTETLRRAVSTRLKIATLA